MFGDFWIRNGEEVIPNALSYYVSYIRFSYNDDVRFLPNPVGETLIFRRNDYISRIGLSFDGGRSTGIASTSRGTWGFYESNANFANDPTGINTLVDPLSVDDEVNVVFNPVDRQAQTVSTLFLNFQARDILRIERIDGGRAGEGYVLELMGAPTINRDSGSDQVIFMTCLLYTSPSPRDS